MESVSAGTYALAFFGFVVLVILIGVFASRTGYVMATLIWVIKLGWVNLEKESLAALIFILLSVIFLIVAIIWDSKRLAAFYKNESDSL